MLNTEAMIANKINISQAVGNRYDVSFYNERFDFISNSYPSYELGQILFVNPAVSYKHIADDDLISFVPMEAIDEQNGIIALRKTILYSNIKGYTKFQEGDLLWAKITPCMQNGKSAIARNLVNGAGCGSTEFYVLRPKSDKVLIEYIHYILRDNRVLESARNSFGGSAGQQRVSSSYLKSIKIPLPPIEIQQQIVDIYTTAQKAKQAKEEQANTLLDSIDDYLLSKLGIRLPAKDNSHIEDANYKIKLSGLLGKRYDPYYHNPYFYTAFQDLNKSKFHLLSLGEISTLITSGMTPKSGGDAYTNAENGVAFIRSGDIDISGEIDFDNLLYIKHEVHNTTMKSSHVKDNDIMIAIVGATIGQVGIYHSNKKANINQAIALVRLKDGYMPEYIKEVIKSSIGQLNLDRLKRPVARANINLEEISSMLIPIPETETQNEIVKNIVSIREQAKQLQKKGVELLGQTKKDIEKIILD